MGLDGKGDERSGRRRRKRWSGYGQMRHMRATCCGSALGHESSTVLQSHPEKKIEDENDKIRNYSKLLISNGICVLLEFLTLQPTGPGIIQPRLRVMVRGHELPSYSTRWRLQAT